MHHLIYTIFNKMSFLVTCLVLTNVNGYVIGNKLTKTPAGTGQSNIAYSQDNKGSYQFAYEVTDKGGATNFRQETGGPKAVKGSYGLTDVDGRTRLVNYQADKYGFVATVDTNEPGTGREDAANAAYNGPDKGKGWAYAVAITDKNDEYKASKNKYDGPEYQSYSYSSNFDENKFNQQNKDNEEQQYNEKNYDRREEYKNPVTLSKPILSQKQSTINQSNKKEDALIKNVNYESGGHFDTVGNVGQTNGIETDKNDEQTKAVTDDNNPDNNLDDNSHQSEEEQYDKRQMHLISHPNENPTKSSSSDYLTTIEKLAKKEKIKSSKSGSKKLISSSSKDDKVISKLISLSSTFEHDDGKWTNEKYIKK